MTRLCDLNNKKACMSGNNVSHSKRKTKTVFRPNLQKRSLKSDVLNEWFSFRVSTNTIRSLDHSGGLDKYLLSANNCILSRKAMVVKKRLQDVLSPSE